MIVVLAALIANLAGGKKKSGTTPPPGVAQVAFVASVKGATNTKSAPSGAVTAEGQQIVSLLNGWYEQTFVDTEKFGDGTFPDIEKKFTAAARTSFKKDLVMLTIGDARSEVKRVDPTVQTAKVTVYFNNGRPTYAIAGVHFAANATMKQSGAFPLKIDQLVTYDFQKTGQGWVVTYYSGNQTQNSIVPSPSPSAS